ncbi:retrovirus-related pol polyprotein from transposon TNT 1-94 [Tanacetum coccineum]
MASSVKVPVAYVTLFSSAQWLQENTDSVFPVGRCYYWDIELAIDAACALRCESNAIINQLLVAAKVMAGVSDVDILLEAFFPTLDIRITEIMIQMMEMMMKELETIRYEIGCLEEEDGEQIRFLGGNSYLGTKKYRGSNSNDGGNTGDGVKIAGEAIRSGDEIGSYEHYKGVVAEVEHSKPGASLLESLMIQGSYGSKDCCLIRVLGGGVVRWCNEDIRSLFIVSFDNLVDKVRSASNPREKRNKSIATPIRKELHQDTIFRNPRVTIGVVVNTNQEWKWWIAKDMSYQEWTQKPLRTKKIWMPKIRKEDVSTSISPTIDIVSRITNIVQLILFIVDSGCTKHMTGNLKLLCNFVEKFLGTVRFGNDQFAPILGYGDLNQGNVTIKRVYYVEGLNHNLFSVGQFCDADLEVAFRKSTCFVRDLQGNDLLTGNRGSDLYTISLQETTSSTPICFMAKASPTQAWLWHRRLSHLNFDYITLLSKKDIVTGLPKLKYVKDQLCSSCEMSKAKRSSFKSKAVPSSKGRLNLLHMDLCGPMRVASINGKKYILVIVDDYSRYTWTLFLRSKDETPEVLKDFLTMIQRNLQAQVISVRTDRGTEFLNKTLHAYFKEEGIEHQTSTPRTPE